MTFSPRAYQSEFVSAVIADLRSHDRVLGVAATGAGKTIIASMIMSQARGRCLFLADAKELVTQNADKFHKFTGETAAVEMAADKVDIADSPKVVVATTQSIARRLEKYPRDYFSLVIVDEAHRNTVGEQAQSVINYFDAKVLGMTATPFRSDRKQLGDYYDTIAVDIGLERLIREGFLSPIIIKSVPVDFDLSQTRTTAGDYNVSDLGHAIEPHLEAAARLLKEHASDRKTVVFLPLVRTSKLFVEELRKIGIRAVHVDGKDREEAAAFYNGEADVICNASLLTTGWDFPETDCVFVLRPTKSLALFQQMVGRGTRIAPGKENMLLLDPLFLTDDHKLITPARLLATTPQQAECLDEVVRSGEEIDLLESMGEAEQLHKDKLEQELREKSKRAGRTIDAMDFCLNVDAYDLASYEPQMGWELDAPSDTQVRTLKAMGFDPQDVTYKGQASKIIDLLKDRESRSLASPKQVRLLKRFRFPNYHLATKAEASRFLGRKFKR